MGMYSINCTTDLGVCMGYKSTGECPDINPCVGVKECECKHEYFTCLCAVNDC